MYVDAQPPYFLSLICTDVAYMYTTVRTYLYDLHHEPGHVLESHASQAVSDGIFQCIVVRLRQDHSRKEVTDDALKEREVLHIKEGRA